MKEYLGFSNMQKINGYVTILKSALQPIFIGLILAYLLAPVETKLELFFVKKHIKKKPAQIGAVFLTAFAVLIVVVIGI
ncbi:MAG: hypothetical protein UHS41_09885 [Lachnospiraceae bacterium]|nr:hypothetical protein [Lachnospiraceae bacterium]